MHRISKHVDRLFAKYKEDQQIKELKEEIIGNLEAKVADLISRGIQQDEAIKIAIESIDSVDNLIYDNDEVEKRNRHRKYWTVFKYIVLFFCVGSVIMLTLQYFQYDKILKESETVTVEERNDFRELKKKDLIELYKIGFQVDEINSIENLDLDSLTLEGILDTIIHTLNRDRDDAVLKKLAYVKDKETTVGKELATINSKIAEAMYSPKEDKTYLKLHYTVQIQKPMIFQFQDNFILMNNDWHYFFGYSKRHYVSKTGKTYFEYSTKDFMPSRRYPDSSIFLDLDIRKKINNEIFCLKGISGVMIIKTSGYKDLYVYGQYKHDQLFKKKEISKFWSEWRMK